MATSRAVVAGNIRAEMARRNVTQARIATRLGKTQQSVSTKLRGHRPISVDELYEIAAELGVEPAALLAGSAS